MFRFDIWPQIQVRNYRRLNKLKNMIITIEDLHVIVIDYFNADLKAMMWRSY